LTTFQLAEARETGYMHLTQSDARFEELEPLPFLPSWRMSDEYKTTALFTPDCGIHGI
jgi:hypothetical protein